MAVYDLRDRGGNGGISVNNLLYMIGGRFLDNMLARDAAARQYTYKSRLDAEAAARTEAEKRGYNDMLRTGARDNPTLQAGSADFLGGAVGSGANLQHLQGYWLPQMLTVDQGDQKTVAPAWPNGDVGDGRSYAMGVDPGKARELTDKMNMFNSELDWNKEQGMWERDYKNRALAQEAALRRSAQQKQHSAQLMPDGKGGMVWVDPVTRSIVPAEGISPNTGSANFLETLLKTSGAYKNFYGNGGPNGSGQGVVDGGDSAAQPQMDPLKFMQIMGILGNGGNGPSFTDYRPAYKDVGDGGMNAYATALQGAAGGFSEAEVAQYAKNRNISIDAARKELSNF